MASPGRFEELAHLVVSAHRLGPASSWYSMSSVMSSTRTRSTLCELHASSQRFAKSRIHSIETAAPGSASMSAAAGWMSGSGPLAPFCRLVPKTNAPESRRGGTANDHAVSWSKSLAAAAARYVVAAPTKPRSRSRCDRRVRLTRDAQTSRAPASAARTMTVSSRGSPSRASSALRSTEPQRRTRCPWRSHSGSCSSSRVLAQSAASAHLASLRSQPCRHALRASAERTVARIRRQRRGAEHNVRPGLAIAIFASLAFGRCSGCFQARPAAPVGGRTRARASSCSQRAARRAQARGTRAAPQTRPPPPSP